MSIIVKQKNEILIRFDNLLDNFDNYNEINYKIQRINLRSIVTSIWLD